MENYKNNIIYSPANETCCPTREVVIDELCENLINISNVSTVINIPNPNGAYVSLTFISDITNNSDATFGIRKPTGDPTLVTVPPGNSVTLVSTNIVEARVFANSTGQTIDGRLCIKIYNQIYLI